MQAQIHAAELQATIIRSMHCDWQSIAAKGQVPVIGRQLKIGSPVKA